MSESESIGSGLGDAISATAEDATATDIDGENIEGKEDGESKKLSSDAVEPNTYDIKPSLEDRYLLSPTTLNQHCSNTTL